MTLHHEARAWTITGAIWFFIGLQLLGFDLWLNGTSVHPGSLTIGIVASFIMLGGLCGVIFGRLLRAVAFGEEPWHADWRQALGFFAIYVGGTIIVLTAAKVEQMPTLNEVARGLAGAFIAMAGVISLLAHRVIHHFALAIPPKEEIKLVRPAA